MKRLCFTCDLKNDPQLIRQYREHHKKPNVWTEVLDSIRASGISNMQIYLVETRMFMIIEAGNEFDLEEKGRKDAQNEQVQKWETMMNQFQKIPEFSKGEKWVLMDKIFDLSEYQ